MSTNPFDSDNRSSGAAAVAAAAGIHRPPRGVVMGGGGSSMSRRNLAQQQQQQLAMSSEPAIWAARNVEWPIPSALSVSNYQKLLRSSRQTASQLGIVSTAPSTSSSSLASEIAKSNLKVSGVGVGAGGVAPISGSDGSLLAGVGGDVHDGGRVDSRGVGGSDKTGGGGGDTATIISSTTESQSYYGLSGFMSRVLSTTGTSSEKMGDNDYLDHHLDSSSASQQQQQQGGGSSRPLRPPRSHCVATANGWIVAALECPSSSSPSLSSSSSSTTAAVLSSTSTGTPLRLVSRWNVRRGAGSSADQWMALPPPVSGDGRILHVFVDPTGCHTLLSARNGEAYYIHSSNLRLPQKLQGFGKNADGSLPAATMLTSISATTVSNSNNNNNNNNKKDKSSSSNKESMIQNGLTPGSWITAVAWDRERGTEGSTKRILLGTSIGEIYEYALISPNSSENDQETKKTDAIALPILLHQLHHSNSNGAGVDAADTDNTPPAAVTGLHAERLRTGILVMASTSGRNKRTRLHTFYSPHNNSFRMVMADQQNSSFVELPGSVDFADLRICNDHFALRTATGIYYGTIDRSHSGPASQQQKQKQTTSTTKGKGMIVDSGILSYDEIYSTGAGNSSSTSSSTVSLALTPHHLIILGENNEVRFVNRVAQKVIQKEKMDFSQSTVAGGGTTGAGDEANISSSSMAAIGYYGELMMDIRRPDQVWLRKGRSLIHISSSQEDRDVWKFTVSKCLEMQLPPPPPAVAAAATNNASNNNNNLSRSLAGAVPALSEEERNQEALFEQAKNLCSNNAQKAVVTAVRAEYHLSQGRSELAAKYFAQCPPILQPFADTSIRLALPMLGIDDPHSYGYSDRAKNSLASSNIPLITYLSDRMRYEKKVVTMNKHHHHHDDKMTSTMIGAWLTELYLHERSITSPPPSSSSSADQKDATSQYQQQQQQQANLLGSFLANYVNNTDAKTIMRILSSHDVSAGECAAYAARSGDIATAVNTALCVSSTDSKQAEEALRILNDAPFAVAEPLYYKHASTLLARAPITAGKSFLSRYSEGLSPTRLLPSIMHYENMRSERAKMKQHDGLEESKSSGGNEKTSQYPILQAASSVVDDPLVSMDYLEGVIKEGCRSSAVYNYLVSLYAKLEDEEPLFRFLSDHMPTGSTFADMAKQSIMAGTTSSDHEMVLQQQQQQQQHQEDGPLDLWFALRNVLSTGRHFRSAIKLYMGFGMRQQAVELALKVDPSLAREIAQNSVELEERKRLWLMIARDAAGSASTSTTTGGGGIGVGGKDVVSKVVSVLKDCGPDVLSIEDALPFLPDFAQIDQIKDEICEALTSYSSKIEGFLKEMNDCDQICDSLRDEIERLRTHRMLVKSDARCAITNIPVLTAGEPFYVFPSGYVFTQSALQREVLPSLNDEQKGRVEQIINQLKKLDDKNNNNNGKNKNKSDKKHNKSTLSSATATTTTNSSNGGTSAVNTMNRGELQAELDGLIAAECPLTGSIIVDSIDRPFDDCDEIDEAFFLDNNNNNSKKQKNNITTGISGIGIPPGRKMEATATV